MKLPIHKVFLHNPATGILGCILSIASVMILAFFAHQSDFTSILTAYALGTIGMYLILTSEIKLSNVLIFGLILRCLFFVELPQLSDDYHRFYWDGSLVMQGINPYTVLPEDICCEGIDHLADAYRSMNSKDKYTLYPPITQLVFALLSSWGIDVFVGMYRVLFVISDVLVFFGLRRLLVSTGRDERHSLAYFLNPAVLSEGVGNLHIEVITVALLLWAYIYYRQGTLWQAALLYFISIGIRVLPLVFLPFLFFRLRRRRWVFAVSIGAAVMALYSPIWLPMTNSGYLQSINLYFTNFEFNASVYYVVRYIGKLYSGYNLIAYIGPLLALVVLGRTLWYSYRSRSVDANHIPHLAASILLFYLLLSTTVHPWYILLLLPFTLLSGLRYGTIWSIAAVLSYSHYWGGGYNENYYLIALEYIILFVAYVSGIQSSNATSEL